MDQIFIQDNFLNKSELDECNKIIQSTNWTWGDNNHIINDKKNFLSYIPFWSIDLMDNYFFSKTMVNIIEKHFSKKFKLIKVYASSQTFGQDELYHTYDNGKKNFTFCLYLTNIISENIETAAGHIFFKFPNLKYNICYEPKYNRGIFFPSNYIYKETSFSRYIMDLKIYVSWKLEEII